MADRGFAMKTKLVVSSVLALAVVFMTGMSVGVTMEDTIERIAVPGMPADRDLDDDLEDVLDAEERLVRELWLTTAQQRTVHRLIDERGARLEAYWDHRMPEMHAIIDSSRAEIRRALSAQQQPKYDEQIARLKRMTTND